jgi:hypothetical protein
MRFILVILCLYFLQGCAENKPILLSPPLQESEIAPINPSLVKPQRGFHPSLGVTAGITSKNLQGLIDYGYNSANFGVHGGLLYQSSLENKWSLGSFASLNTKGMYSLINLDPSVNTSEKLSSEDDDKFNKTFSAISSELLARCGISTKLSKVNISLYVDALGQYEQGSYFKYRKQINEIANYYNLSENELTYGYGFGGDISFGKTAEWDVGVAIEFHNFITKTQTYESHHIENGTYVVEKIQNGINIATLIPRALIYYDIENFRFSYSYSPLFTPNVQAVAITYRW